MYSTVECKIKMYNDWKIFSIVGRFDTLTADEVERAAAKVLHDHGKVAVNMSAINYISSAGLKALLRLAKQAKRDQKIFVLFGAKDMIKEVLDVSRMDLLITIYNSIDDLP